MMIKQPILTTPSNKYSHINSQFNTTNNNNSFNNSLLFDNHHVNANMNMLQQQQQQHQQHQQNIMMTNKGSMLTHGLFVNNNNNNNNNNNIYYPKSTTYTPTPSSITNYHLPISSSLASSLQQQFPSAAISPNTALANTKNTITSSSSGKQYKQRQILTNMSKKSDLVNHYNHL